MTESEQPVSSVASTGTTTLLCPDTMQRRFEERPPSSSRWDSSNANVVIQPNTNSYIDSFPQQARLVSSDDDVIITSQAHVVSTEYEHDSVLYQTWTARPPQFGQWNNESSLTTNRGKVAADVVRSSDPRAPPRNFLRGEHAPAPNRIVTDTSRSSLILDSDSCLSPRTCRREDETRRPMAKRTVADLSTSSTAVHSDSCACRLVSYEEQDGGFGPSLVSKGADMSTSSSSVDSHSRSRTSSQGEGALKPSLVTEPSFDSQDAALVLKNLARECWRSTQEQCWTQYQNSKISATQQALSEAATEHFHNQPQPEGMEEEEERIEISIAEVNTKSDVVCGRGGMAHFPGNIRYRTIIDGLKEKHYDELPTNEAFRILLCDAIISCVHDWGGRFLVKEDGRWYIETKSKAREKTLKTLREKRPLQSKRVHTTTETTDEIDEAEIRDIDILDGRGGKANHHPGNKRFRDLVETYKDHYRKIPMKDRNVKKALSSRIVEEVYAYGGRFIQKNNDSGSWRELTRNEACIKTSRTLREGGVIKPKLSKVKSMPESRDHMIVSRETELRPASSDYYS